MVETGDKGAAVEETAAVVGSTAVYSECSVVERRVSEGAWCVSRLKNEKCLLHVDLSLSCRLCCNSSKYNQ